MWCCLPQPLSACGARGSGTRTRQCRHCRLPPLALAADASAVCHCHYCRGTSRPHMPLARAATAAVYLSPFKSSISDSQLSVRSPWFVSTSRRPTALCPSPPQSPTPVQRRVASICSSRLPALHFASSLLPLSQAAASGLLSSFLMPLLKAVSFPSVGRSRRLAGHVYHFPVSN